jgi:hypothetical protein
MDLSLLAQTCCGQIHHPVKKSIATGHEGLLSIRAVWSETETRCHFMKRHRLKIAHSSVTD